MKYDRLKERKEGMKLARVKHGEEIFLGIEKEGLIINLSEVNLSKDFTDMRDFLENHKESDLKELLEGDIDIGKGIKTQDLEYMSPFQTTAHDILCVGLNYQDHINESQDILGDEEKDDKYGTYFSKRSHKILGNGEYIELDETIDDSLDYETELAIVIGKKGKNIPEEEAMDYIFGFTILNDLTARSMQKQYGQWYKGKSVDGYLSMGPSLVHKSAFQYPLSLKIATSVNGETRQDSNTKYMIRGLSRIIHEISKGMTLVPGDIIATGTPEGVGMGFKPTKYLKDGDIIQSSIEGIGSLSNKVKSIR